MRSWLKILFTMLAAVSLTALIIAEADARSGRGGSIGSRGARTAAPPPVTNAAPNQARPFERTTTQPGQPATAARPGAQTPAAGGLFNRPGLLGGLAAGFLGAGLLGLLMGNGFLGGLAGLASVFGLLLQVGLIGGAVWLVMRWWRGRSQPRPAYAGGRGMEPSRRLDLGGTGSGMGGVGSGATSSAMFGGMRPPQPSADIEVSAADYDAFERLLGEVQDSYGREDLTALRLRATPEMVSYFAEEFTDNAARGQINEIAGGKLLQGDLAEAWREGNAEYATVAMRYEIIDRMRDRASGEVVEGGDTPVEVTELWTFRRALGGDWMLSAIQQTG